MITSNFARENQEVISAITQELYERITKATETYELNGYSTADFTIQEIDFRVQGTFDYILDEVGADIILALGGSPGDNILDISSRIDLFFCGFRDQKGVGNDLVSKIHSKKEFSFLSC